MICLLVWPSFISSMIQALKVVCFALLYPHCNSKSTHVCACLHNSIISSGPSSQALIILYTLSVVFSASLYSLCLSNIYLDCFLHYTLIAIQKVHIHISIYTITYITSNMYKLCERCPCPCIVFCTSPLYHYNMYNMYKLCERCPSS